MFSNFFIKRPIFAIVVSLVIVISGLISMFQLPIEQYPNMAPADYGFSQLSGSRCEDRGRNRSGPD